MPEEYTYTFDQGREGWAPMTTMGALDDPLFLIEGEALGLSPGGSNDCFGFWQSPGHEFTVGQRYRMRARIRTTQADRSKVPTVRLRLSDASDQVLPALAINSRGKGENAPSTVGTVYEMIYQPSSLVLEKGYNINFDLINVDSEDDDPNAKVYLDMLEIKKVNVTVP